jgi:hypothetical protein
LDKPLHVIYKASKLAYRILVILIANERVKNEEEKKVKQIIKKTLMSTSTVPFMAKISE